MSMDEYGGGPAGTSNIVNQDEQALLRACVNDVAMVVVPGGADDFSHVSPVFRESAAAPITPGDF